MKRFLPFMMLFVVTGLHAAKVPDLDEDDALALLRAGGAANPIVLAIVYNSSAPRLNLQSGAEIATLIYTEESEEAGSSASSTTVVYSHFSREWIILIPTNDESGYYRVTKQGAAVVPASAGEE